MEIETRRLADLKPADYNPRKSWNRVTRNMKKSPAALKSSDTATRLS